jgi:hypothetical protein
MQQISFKIPCEVKKEIHFSFGMINRSKLPTLLLSTDTQMLWRCSFRTSTDPASNNNQAIREASRHGHKEVVKILLRDKSESNFALQQAAKNNHKEIVEMLLKDRLVAYLNMWNPIYN